jgi:DNA polymerase I-like protein with 3'-5' exonuclease and polymerase domains
MPKVKTLINHAAKFEMHFSENLGFKIPQMQCTMVRAALIDEHEKSFSLDSLGEKHVGMGKTKGIYDELAALFGGAADRKTQMANLHRAPESLAARYALADPEIAIRLWLWQEEQIRAQDLSKIWGLERLVTPVLQKMERRGVRIDVPYIATAKGIVQDKAMQAQSALDKLIGKPTNVNSGPQLRAAFKPEARDGHFYIGNVRIDSTDGGQPSLDKEALVTLEEAGHPLARHVMNVRRFLKAGQFLDEHILGHLCGDRVHANFNQTKTDKDMGTITGRLSCDDPALQQIPSRDKEVAAIVRAAFIPEEGHAWLCSDWAQFEFRVFGHYVNSPEINNVYSRNPDADFHKLVADLSGLPRDPPYAGGANAKQLNLGMVFGMGEGLMAQKMGLPFKVEVVKFRGESEEREIMKAGDEAKEKFELYHKAIPGVRKLLEKASSLAKSRGYVITLGGRRLRFPHGQFTHKAGGLVFQGTSADAMKQKLVELDAAGFDGLNLSVHDEFGMSVPKEETGVYATAVRNIVTDFGPGSAIPLRIPVLASINFGENWWEASK